MRFSCEHLTFKALVALYEVAQQGYQGTVPQSRSLRFLLAYLYAAGQGDRAFFDRFWRTCQDTPPGPQPGYQRGTYLNTCWEAIARTVGAEISMTFLERIQAGGRIDADRRREATEALAASVRYVRMQEEEAKDLKRVNYWRPAVRPVYASGIPAPAPPSDLPGRGAEDPARPDSCPSASDPDPLPRGS